MSDATERVNAAVERIAAQLQAQAEQTDQAIRQITMTYKAEIKTHPGWWFRYTVHRTMGIGIPENSVSLHHTLSRARRAARRWTRRNDRLASRVVESHR